VSKLWVEVSAPDFDAFTVPANLAEGVIEIIDLPAGRNRTFAVVSDGLNGQGAPISRRYGGKANVDLNAGETKDVQIAIGNLPNFSSGTPYTYYQVNTDATYLTVTLPDNNGAVDVYMTDKTNGDESFVSQLSGTNTYISQSGLVPGHTYNYRLVPVNGYGRGIEVETTSVWLDPNYIN
jgi:hypothetical protein